MRKIRICKKVSINVHVRELAYFSYVLVLILWLIHARMGSVVLPVFKRNRREKVGFVKIVWFQILQVVIANVLSINNSVIMNIVSTNP